MYSIIYLNHETAYFESAMKSTHIIQYKLGFEENAELLIILTSGKLLENVLLFESRQQEFPIYMGS
jgi:hypothetical protein